MGWGDRALVICDLGCAESGFICVGIINLGNCVDQLMPRARCCT